MLLIECNSCERPVQSIFERTERASLAKDIYTKYSPCIIHRSRDQITETSSSILFFLEIGASQWKVWLQSRDYYVIIDLGTADAK